MTDSSNYRVVSAVAVPPCQHSVVMNFTYGGGGIGKGGKASVLVDGT